MFGYPLDHFGITLAVLGPLGHYFGDFGIILGPSDCRKSPKSDKERCEDAFGGEIVDILCEFGRKKTLTGVLTKCFPLKQL